MDPTAPTELGRRDRNKKATRHRICQSIIDLTVGRSLEEVTVEDIAEHADVSRRTFFNYFQSKEEALLATPMDVIAQIERLLLLTAEDLIPWQALEEAVLAAVAEVDASTDRHTMRRIVAMDETSVDQARMYSFGQIERRLVADVARRMAVDPARDVRPALLVGAAVTGLRVALATWSTTEPEVALSDVTRRCLDSLGEGLRAERTTDLSGASATAT